MSERNPEAEIDAQALRAYRDGIVVEPSFYVHIPVKLRLLMEICAETHGLSMAAIRGRRQAHNLVNARSVIAVLSKEFLPRMTMVSIEDGMLRGAGWVAWARERHRDRLALYPAYRQLFGECHAAVQARRSDFLVS